MARFLYIARFLPKTFRFSWKITLFCLVLAAVMVRCSMWQWERYKYKVQLVETYEVNSSTEPLPFPTAGTSASDFENVLHRRVRLTGSYDFSQQMVVKNRRHASGPGFWLLTPLKIEGSDRSIVVSRGFIPFADDKPELWEQYNFSTEEEFDAVVQPTVPHRVLLAPKNPTVSSDTPFVHKWLYPDIEKMAKQLPENMITAVYLQRIGGPPIGTFPAEAISIDVPPSTHFGYTIEWLLLAIGTLVVGFFLQAFPRGSRRSAPPPLQVVNGNKSVHLLLCALLLHAIPAQALEDPKIVKSDGSITERLGQNVPLDTRFVDASGQDVALADLLLPGRPMVIIPVYFHCPRLCDLTLSGVSNLLRAMDLELGKDFSIATLSFNPDEGPELAQEKAAKYYQTSQVPQLAQDNWHFLTGSKENIAAVMDALGFGYLPDRGEYAHAAGMMVVTPLGKISRYFYGIEYPKDKVRIALVEASEGKIGSTFEKIFLYCFRFDPTRGKYTPVVMNITRLVCLGFFVILATTLVCLRVREKRKSNA